MRRFLGLIFWLLFAATLLAAGLLWYDSVRGDGNGIVAGFWIGAWFAPLLYLTLGVGFVAALASKKSAIQGTAVAVLMTGLTIAALEWVCGVLLRSQAGKEPAIVGPVHLTTDDPVLGYKPYADSTYWGTRVRGSTDTIYHVRYRTESHSLRQTPTDSAASSKYALFFGCSMTFGEGVENGETIPSELARQVPGYHAYNLGFSGYGPHQTLVRLQQRSPRNYVPEPNGVAVYTYLNDHVNRVIGTLTNYTYNGGNVPYFYHEGDSLRYGGLMRDARPLRSWVYGKLMKSNILKLFKIGYPFRLSDDDYALTADVLAESARAYRRQFGNDNFYVLLYPTTTSVEPIKSMLQQRGVKVLDYSKLFPATDPKYAIRYDEHPTPLANRVLVARLVKDLKLN
jgi:hypothetical protein